MQHILSDLSASITELKQNPGALLEKAKGNAVVILNRNVPTAYLVPPELFEQLLEALDDIQLNEIVHKRQGDLEKAVEVSLGEL